LKIWKYRPKDSFALPLDCFRIGVGSLTLLYFFRTIFEAPYYLAHDGFINHELLQHIFWFTWQPIFHPSMSTPVVQMILSLGILFSLFLIIGFRPRLSAFILYIMVVCLYRYQFLVFFVDDVIMHLLLFWCFILPVGNTLKLIPWLKNKHNLSQWKEIKVESLGLSLFLFNIALIYFVAGVSKFTSSLWLDGVAVLAVLKLPMAWFSAYSLEDYEILLKIGNYLALILEAPFALLVLLKPWSRLKLLLGLLLVIFHLFIIVTLDVPFANLGCLTLVPLIFRHEVMDLFFKKNKSSEISNVSIKNYRIANRLALIMVFFLTGAMMCQLAQGQWRNAKRDTGKSTVSETKISSAESGGIIQTGFYAGLWAMGLAQGYRLLDWIDERNFHQTITIFGNDKILSTRLVPPGMRGNLMMTYISDITWMHVHPEFLEQLKKDVKKRLKSVYCRNFDKKTKIVVTQSLTKIDSFRPLYRPAETILKFECENFKLLVTKD
jgi:hypothetical protein